MHIMTENGWRSLGGYAERIARESAERREREDKARTAYYEALAAPLPNRSEEAHRAKHAQCNQLFRNLMEA